MFQKGEGDWTQYRNLGSYEEVDFHFSEYGRREEPYYVAMERVTDLSLKALETAQTENKEFVIFTHGRSTSHRGKTTARSQVRSLMRSTSATPYIIRKDCIQHDSVFVAAIRPKNS